MTLRLAKLAAAAAIVLAPLAAFADVKLTGAGATFPKPLYDRWVAEYSAKNPGVMIDYQGGGSGAGIKGITEKTIDFAGSDAPMSKSELEKLGGAEVVHIPTVAGAVVAAYNLPGVTDLKLSGPVLADIYAGKIAKWNDAKIAQLNPGMTLPDTAITPVYRTDGSGTNFVFTSYLSEVSPTFKSAVGMGKQVKFPSGQGGKGSDGVTAVVQSTPGAVGYVELNFAVNNNLSHAMMQNKAGKFVKASPESVSAAGKGSMAEMMGDSLACDIWNADGEMAYPIAAYTYVIVYKDLNYLKDKEKAAALAKFIKWSVGDGQQQAASMSYAPLAPEVKAKIDAQLGKMMYDGKPMMATGM